jgi:dolichol-phosphate mannosyltransferase
MRWFPSGFRHWWNGQSFDLEEVTPRYRDGNGPGRSESKKGGTVNPQKILVILPTYNEAETIKKVLEEAQAKAPGTEILVVDDNSPDGTAAKVKQTPNFGKKVHLLERPGKAGLGSAYKEGFQWAMKRGYDAVVVLDVGLSYDPADIPKLIQALTEGADIAVGSRYLNGVRVLNWPQSRLWMSLCAAMGVRMLVGLPMTDPASRFHAIRRRVFEGLHWDQSLGPESDSPIEIYLRAWQAGFRVHEVPIVFAGREEGQSKISLLMARGTAWRVLQLAFRRVFP